MGERVRTAADVDITKPEEPQTTRARLQSPDQFSPTKTRHKGITEPTAPSEFPEMEHLNRREEPLIQKAASNFANLYSNYSSSESVRAGINLAAGVKERPGLVTMATNEISRGSQVAASALQGAITGLGIAQSAIGAVTSAQEARDRYSNVLKARQDLSSTLQAKFGSSLTYSDGILTKEIHNPEMSHLTTGGMLRDVLQFAENKEQKRVARAAAQALGNALSAAGGAMTVAGAAGAGIGAAPGIIVGAIGSGIGLAVSAGQAYNGIIKKFMGTKGADRNSAATFIWGLALRHHGAKIIDEGPAAEALRLAEAWASKTPEDSMKDVQRYAHEYLETMGLIGTTDMYDDSAIGQVSLTDDACGQAIFRNLGSVPSS